MPRDLIPLFGGPVFRALLGLEGLEERASASVAVVGPLPDFIAVVVVIDFIVDHDFVPPSFGTFIIRLFLAFVKLNFGCITSNLLGKKAEGLQKPSKLCLADNLRPLAADFCFFLLPYAEVITHFSTEVVSVKSLDSVVIVSFCFDFSCPSKFHSIHSFFSFPFGQVYNSIVSGIVQPQELDVIHLTFQNEIISRFGI